VWVWATFFPALNWNCSVSFSLIRLAPVSETLRQLSKCLPIQPKQENQHGSWLWKRGEGWEEAPASLLDVVRFSSLERWQEIVPCRLSPAFKTKQWLRQELRSHQPQTKLVSLAGLLLWTSFSVHWILAPPELLMVQRWRWQQCPQRSGLSCRAFPAVHTDFLFIFSGSSGSPCIRCWKCSSSVWVVVLEMGPSWGGWPREAGLGKNGCTQGLASSQAVAVCVSAHWLCFPTQCLVRYWDTAKTALTAWALGTDPGLP
jgi:hypothetical protein